MASTENITPESAKTPAKFIVAITYTEEKIKANALQEFTHEYGEVDFATEPFRFTHTKYYEQEMGPNLLKQFFSFRKLLSPENLVAMKLFAIAIEKRFSIDDKRRVNLDPAYLELAKLVVASTKNFAHRIYLGQGIYGDLQLRYRKNDFVIHEWTYPDYRESFFMEFLRKVRTAYFQQLQTQ